MNRIPVALILTLALGCDSAPPPPAVLQEAELKEKITLEHAGDIDPESVLFTIHEGGRVTWKGKVQTREVMLARASSTPGKLNRKPILFEVDPKAGFDAVRDVLELLTGNPHCVNYAFLVSSPKGAGIVPLPMQDSRTNGIHLFEGRNEEKVIGHYDSKYLELVISAGKDGAIEVKAVNFTIPGSEPAIFYPEARDTEGNKADQPSKAPDISWHGEHPPCGIWTLEGLRTFLARPDVAALSPYIVLKITTQERAADVIHCLSALGSIGSTAVIPDIPTKK